MEAPGTRTRSPKFALPDLRGRVPLSSGQGETAYQRGDSGGVITVTLTEPEIRSHRHALNAFNAPGDTPTPGGASPARYANAYQQYPASLAEMDDDLLRSAGGGAPHPNMMPYLPLMFCIALWGVLPAQHPHQA